MTNVSSGCMRRAMSRIAACDVADGRIAVDERVRVFGLHAAAADQRIADASGVLGRVGEVGGRRLVVADACEQAVDSALRAPLDAHIAVLALSARR